MKVMKERAKAASEARMVPSPFREEEIRYLTAYLEQRAGLFLSDEASEQARKKLSAILQEIELPEGEKLYDSLRRSDEVLQRVINLLTVGESYFFRNRPHFEALRRNIIPDIAEENRRRRSLRIWCAGCARGEEPYSLSILLAEHFPELLRWKVSITATDINTDFLDQAQKGVYTRWSLRGLEPDLLSKYFVTVGGSGYQLDERIRKTVDFRYTNLREYSPDAAETERAFDLVLCRNVLIYFSLERALEIIGALAASLRVGGYLLLGHSETVPVPLELETVHFDATYAYRRVPERQVANIRRRRDSFSSMLAIPGTGAVSILPPRPATLLPVSQRQPTAKRSRRARPVSRRRRTKPGLQPTRPVDEMATEIERAREHADRGEIAEAHEILEKLVRTEGVLDHRVYFLHAIVSDQRGRPRDTVESLRKSIFLHKGFALGHYYLGVILEREGEASVAERYLRNARNLLLKLPQDVLLEEAEGLTSGRLLEIIEARLKEVCLR